MANRIVDSLNKIPAGHNFVLVVPKVARSAYDSQINFLEMRAFDDKDELESYIMTNLSTLKEYKVVELIPCDVSVSVEIVQKV